ncbi:MAG TPA: RnfH family protein, partial [Lysobacter sp.]
MRVEVVRAWPRAFERIELELPAGATAADALSAAGIEPGDAPFAIFGARADPGTPLMEGDRI